MIRNGKVEHILEYSPNFDAVHPIMVFLQLRVLVMRLLTMYFYQLERKYFRTEKEA